MPDIRSDIAKILEHLKEELHAIRSGRAHPSLLENIPVAAYGSTMKLVELAAITIPEPRLIVIQPWDRGVLKDIERGIREAGLDLNPVVDGERIRVPLPSLTEERRREYLKLAGEHCEQARISLRQLRDRELKLLRVAEQAGGESEDALARERKSIDEAIKDATEQVAQSALEKEKELMTI